jgi:type I restriction enzyme S subunit
MAVKKGYKQTEVGVIPEDWEVMLAGNLVDLLTGFPFPSSQYTNSGIRLLRGSNVKRNRTDWSDEITQYWPFVHGELRRYLLRDGDIVIAMDGSLVGRSFASIQTDDLPALLLQRVARVRSDIASQKFLKEWFCSQFFTDHCDAVKTTTAIPHISPADIKAFKIPLPPTLAEQEAIAGALSDADAWIESLEQLIAKKRQIKQGAMQELLTGKRRLPGFSGKWETKRLGDHCQFLRNGTNSRAELTVEGSLKYLHYGDIHSCNGVYICPKSLPSLPTPKANTLDRLQDGDLVLADASEDTIGISRSVEIVDTDGFELVAGLHTIAVRFSEGIFAPRFAGYLQHCPDFNSHLRKLAAGTKVYATNRRHVSSAEVIIPRINEQTAIATVLSDMDTEIESLESKLAKAREVKQGMMQELLTGRIRLV